MGTAKLQSSTRRRTDAAGREGLLARFDRSGLSAAVFARQHHINYTTFCGWRHRRDPAKGLSPPALQLLLDGVELKAAGRRAWHEAA